MHNTGIKMSDIPDPGSRGFSYEGEDYFVVKKDNHLYAYKNSCPHLWVSLDWVEDQFLDSSNSMIQCANHGALFVIESGKCVAGPCSGQKLTPLAVAVHGDFIFIS